MHFTERSQEKYIVNDCGNADKWPVFAKSIGYGAIGTNGAGSAVVTDRFHDGGHSLFFDKTFIKKYWKTFFESGEIVDSEEVSRKNLPAEILPFDLLPSWIVILSILTILLVSAYSMMSLAVVLLVLLIWLWRLFR